MKLSTIFGTQLARYKRGTRYRQSRSINMEFYSHNELLRAVQFLPHSHRDSGTSSRHDFKMHTSMIFMIIAILMRASQFNSNSRVLALTCTEYHAFWSVSFRHFPMLFSITFCTIYHFSNRNCSFYRRELDTHAFGDQLCCWNGQFASKHSTHLL